MTMRIAFKTIVAALALQPVPQFTLAAAQPVRILALGDTVSQNGRPGQWDNLPISTNFSTLRMRRA